MCHIASQVKEMQVQVPIQILYEQKGKPKRPEGLNKPEYAKTVIDEGRMMVDRHGTPNTGT